MVTGQGSCICFLNPKMLNKYRNFEKKTQREHGVRNFSVNSLFSVVT